MWQSWHYLKKWIGLTVFLVDATCDSDSYRSEQESNLVHGQYAPILRLNHSCCVLANLLFTCVFFLQLMYSSQKLQQWQYSVNFSHHPILIVAFNSVVMSTCLYRDICVYAVVVI